MTATVGAESAVVANVILVTADCIDAFQYDAFQNNAFEVCGEIVRPARAAGHSRFYGPFADLDDRPAPVRTLKKRKQVTEAKRPPEYYLAPESVPLPPEFLTAPPRIAMPMVQPVKTRSSGIEDMSVALGEDIRQATDESSDIEDAIMVLKALQLI